MYIQQYQPSNNFVNLKFFQHALFELAFVNFATTMLHNSSKLPRSVLHISIADNNYSGYPFESQQATIFTLSSKFSAP